MNLFEVNKYKKRFSKYNGTLKTAILLSVFMLFFWMYQTTDFWADDLVYMNIFGTNEPVRTIRDVFVSQYEHYFIWGGRTVAHLIVQTLLLLNKPFSSMANAIAATALVYMCYHYSNKKHVLSLLLAISFVYFFNPDFEETTRWLTGCCNYVWTILLCLLFFLPYVRYVENHEEKNSIYKSCLMLIGGILAGWTNENIGPVFVLMSFTIIIWSRIKLGKIPVWTVFGLIGVTIGTALLLLAPGNGVRSADIATEINVGYSVLKTLMVRCYYIERAVFTCLFPTLLALGLTLYVTIFIYKIYPDMISIMFICAGILSVGAMILSPTYPIRATYGSMILFVIALMRTTVNLLENGQFFKKIYYVAGWSCFVAFVMQMLTIILYAALK